MFPGHKIRGAGLFAMVVAVPTLLAGLMSGVVALKTVAVFPITVPFLTEQFTSATIVMIAVENGGSDAKVIVRLFPVPPQTPPPVELQETNERLEDNTSFTLTEFAAAGPAFVTTI